jgi:hypothetical protein
MKMYSSAGLFSGTTKGIDIFKKLDEIFSEN